MSAAASTGMAATLHGMDRQKKRDLCVGLAMGVVANLAAAALLNNPFHARAVTWLAVLAMVNELLGLLLIASPEILPAAREAWLAVQDRAFAVRQTFVELVRTLRDQRTFRVGRSLKIGHASDVSTVGGITLSGHAVSGTVEERVAELEAQQRELRATLDGLTTQLARLPEQWRAEIDGAVATVQRETEQLVRATADRRLGLRLTGVAYVAVGLMLSGFANLA